MWNSTCATFRRRRKEGALNGACLRLARSVALLLGLGERGSHRFELLRRVALAPLAPCGVESDELLAVTKDLSKITQREVVFICTCFVNLTTYLPVRYLSSSRLSGGQACNVSTHPPFLASKVPEHPCQICSRFALCSQAHTQVLKGSRV